MAREPRKEGMGLLDGPLWLIGEQGSHKELFIRLCACEPPRTLLRGIQT